MRKYYLLTPKGKKEKVLYLEELKDFIGGAVKASPAGSQTMTTLDSSVRGLVMAMKMQKLGNINISTSVLGKLTLVPFLDPRSCGSVAFLWLLL